MQLLSKKQVGGAPGGDDPCGCGRASLYWSTDLRSGMMEVAVGTTLATGLILRSHLRISTVKLNQSLAIPVDSVHELAGASPTGCGAVAEARFTRARPAQGVSFLRGYS